MNKHFRTRLTFGPVQNEEFYDRFVNYSRRPPKLDIVQFVCICSIAFVSWLLGVLTFMAYVEGKEQQREALKREIIAERPSIEIHP